jgi:hypothetical protein
MYEVSGKLTATLAVSKVRESLAVSKQAAQNTYRERFNLRKLNELKVRKQYQTEIDKTSAKKRLGLH